MEDAGTAHLLSPCPDSQRPAERSLPSRSRAGSLGCMAKLPPLPLPGSEGRAAEAVGPGGSLAMRPIPIPGNRGSWETAPRSLPSAAAPAPPLGLWTSSRRTKALTVTGSISLAPVRPCPRSSHGPAPWRHPHLCQPQEGGVGAPSLANKRGSVGSPVLVCPRTQFPMRYL